MLALHCLHCTVPVLLVPAPHGPRTAWPRHCTVPTRTVPSLHCACTKQCLHCTVPALHCACNPLCLHCTVPLLLVPAHHAPALHTVQCTVPTLHCAFTTLCFGHGCSVRPGIQFVGYTLKYEVQSKPPKDNHSKHGVHFINTEPKVVPHRTNLCVLTMVEQHQLPYGTPGPSLHCTVLSLHCTGCAQLCTAVH